MFWSIRGLWNVSVTSVVALLLGEADDFDVGYVVDHGQPGDAWLQIETTGTGGPRVHDQSSALVAKHQRLVGMAVNENVAGIASKEAFRAWPAQFVTVTDVQHEVLHGQRTLARKHRIKSIVDIAGDRFDGRKRLETAKHVVSADVAGVDNQIDVTEHARNLRSQQAVRVGDQPNYQRSSHDHEEGTQNTQNAQNTNAFFTMS
jgi:hypothetical protein